MTVFHFAAHLFIDFCCQTSHNNNIIHAVTGECWQNVTIPHSTRPFTHSLMPHLPHSCRHSHAHSVAWAYPFDALTAAPDIEYPSCGGIFGHCLYAGHMSAITKLPQTSSENILLNPWQKYVAITMTKICCYSYDKNMLLFPWQKYVAIPMTKICCYYYDKNMLLLLWQKYVAITMTNICCYYYDKNMLLLLWQKYVAITMTKICCYSYDK